MPIPWTLLACAPPHSSLWHPVSLRVREGTFEGRKLAFDLTDGEVIASTTVDGTHLPSPALLGIQPSIFLILQWLRKENVQQFVDQIACRSDSNLVIAPSDQDVSAGFRFRTARQISQ
jgi:hypothetical protein